MSITQDSIIASIPSHLRQFVVKQHYNEYTSQDHAVWRYIMRRNVSFLKDVAHPSYLDGLKSTGIRLDRIPHIDEMNECLAKLGWKAVVVDGFVPPAAFMEFQEHRILVISAEIRNAQNIRYTPAPDIIHEAAGHAPLIADPTYAEFLMKTGTYGAKTIFSALDYELYEAIRMVSILKEYPDADPNEIKRAEDHLADKQLENSTPSEAALLARLHWWTVEYGLVGTTDNFKLYGAGLLSSVGESLACIQPSVKKLPLSIDCCHTDYDITQMQPQLYVARNFEHLIEVLDEFADGMCFRKGGALALNQVIASENIGTIELSSGIQISGKFIPVQNIPNFLKTDGPTALAVDGKELPGQGTKHHHHGFSTPIGLLIESKKPLELFTQDDLAYHEIRIQQNVTLKFESDIVVNGILNKIHSHRNKIILMTFSNCSVTAPNGELLFHPEWGIFDMAVGETITSGYSGTADKVAFNVYPNKSEKVAIKPTYSQTQKRLFQLYSDLQHIDVSNSNPESLFSLYNHEYSEHRNDWLIRLELLGKLNADIRFDTLREQIVLDLNMMTKHSTDADLIHAGLSLYTRL